MVASSWYVYPYSMSYFNGIVPVQERPECLLGSNIDWGQDAYFLQRFLSKHSEIKDIRIEYPCPEGIERLGIKTLGSPPIVPEPGWFALGANDIYAASGRYSWFKRCKPVAMVGYSIYVYHVSSEEVERLNRESGQETIHPENERK